MRLLSLGRISPAAGGVLVSLSLGLPGVAAAEDRLPSREEMWRIIQEQQREIQTLKQQQQETRQKFEETDKKVEATGAMVEQAQEGGQGWWQRTQIGGYGENHYNGGETDQVDFHRYVLFFGHDFDEDIRLFSELELEHALAGEGADGEVELEQAYIEFDLFDTQQQARAGVQLLPIGILNEVHEPTTFYGVERNPVENNIIPTTWWEAAGTLAGELGGGFSYTAMIHSGLRTPITGSNAFRVRNGRQKVSEARAEDGAFTGRIRYTGIPGVELAASAQYQMDMTQGQQALPPSGGLTGAKDLNVRGILVEGHADIKYEGFGLRALYARWDLSSDEPMVGPEANGRDVQYGWYLEPSYRFTLPKLADYSVGDLGVFFRFSEWDNEAGLDTSGVETTNRRYDVGFNYWPHPDVVLKFDYFWENLRSGSRNNNGMELGVGYVF